MHTLPGEGTLGAHFLYNPFRLVIGLRSSREPEAAVSQLHHHHSVVRCLRLSLLCHVLPISFPGAQRESRSSIARHFKLQVDPELRNFLSRPVVASWLTVHFDPLTTVIFVGILPAGSRSRMMHSSGIVAGVLLIFAYIATRMSQVAREQNYQTRGHMKQRSVENLLHNTVFPSQKLPHSSTHDRSRAVLRFLSVDSDSSSFHGAQHPFSDHDVR